MIETLLDIEATVSILSDKSSTPSADAPKTKRRKKTAKGAVKKAGLKSGSLKEPIQDKGVC